MRELALREVQVGAKDQQALPEVLVRLRLNEASAVVAPAQGPFAVLLEELVGDQARSFCCWNKHASACYKRGEVGWLRG